MKKQQKYQKGNKVVKNIPMLFCITTTIVVTNLVARHVPVVFAQTPVVWTQRGGDIDGEAAEDQSGYSVSLSADGNVVAIGASYNDGNGQWWSGHVRVYEWDVDGSAWTQRGDDIDGEAAEDQSGYSVSLSADGNVVAISAPYNDGKNGPISGHIRVYEWDVASRGWAQRGDDIDGEAEYDKSGWSVSLSADGNVVAIGAPFKNDGNGQWSGRVCVYEWDVDGSAWTQRGDDIDGEAAYDRSGWSVSLSADGSVVAISAYPTSDENGQRRSGHVCVYEWDVDGSAWTQCGDYIDGEAEYDKSGWSVSLSADGNVVAIGAPYNDGNEQFSAHVRVYEWDVDGSSWTQHGDDIDGGEDAYDQSGVSVSLSADGNVVAIGADWNDGNGQFWSGHVRVYEWDVDGSGWTQYGSDINGEAAYDRSGWSVSLSADGSVVAIGAPWNNGNGYQSGHIRVYEVQKDTSQDLSSTHTTTHFLCLNILITSFVVLYLTNST